MHYIPSNGDIEPNKQKKNINEKRSKSSATTYFISGLHMLQLKLHITYLDLENQCIFN